VTQSIRVALVGCGRISRYHAMHLRTIEGVDVVAVVDSDFARSNAAAQALGAVPFSSFEEMMERVALDAVHILTPPQEHFAQARTALRKGIHTLIEKPVCATLDEFSELDDIATRGDLQICPGYINLFHPLVVEAFQNIRSGTIGDLLHCEVHMSLDAAIPDLQESMRPHWTYCLPGGQMQNYISHPLSLLVQAIGDPISIELGQRSLGALPQGLTDHLDVRLVGARATGAAIVSFGLNPKRFTFTAWGAQGKIHIDLTRALLTLQQRTRLPDHIDRVASSYSEGFGLIWSTSKTVAQVVTRRVKPYQGLLGLFSSFYSCLRHGTAPPVSPGVTRAVCRAEAAILSKIERPSLCHHRQATVFRNTAQKPVVLVTGATGYVGRPLVSHLLAGGYAVRVLVRPQGRTEKLTGLDVDIRFGDVRDTEAVYSAVEGAQFVVHLAAALHGSIEFMTASATDGTRNLVQACRLLHVRRAVYVSSMSVYDFSTLPSNGLLTADSQLEVRPKDRGAASCVKRLAEDVILEEARQPDTLWGILRPGLIFGGGRDPWTLFGPRLGRWVVCLARPKALLRLIHVDDVAEGIIRLLKTPPESGQVYLLAHPEPVTYNQCAAILRQDYPTVRVAHVPYVVAIGIATLLRICRLLSKKFPRITNRRLTYLYKSARCDSGELFKALGWRPTSTLPVQLRAEWTSGSASRARPAAAD
jgi:predicted dehydrogenase/nucleoside-diphosphate-sugar epimerase